MAAKRKKPKKRKAAPRSKWRVKETKLDVQREIAGIIRSAQKYEGRVVGIEQFIFFSTETGDAWLLDIADNLALCLARDSVAQDAHVQETAEQLLVAWEARFQISGAMFIVVTESGQERMIMGYPTQEILQMAQKMHKLRGR